MILNRWNVVAVRKLTTEWFLDMPKPGRLVGPFISSEEAHIAAEALNRALNLEWVKQKSEELGDAEHPAIVWGLIAVIVLTIVVLWWLA